jgi:eukaryotic-like serine/threonine-protein kinase
MSKLEVELKTVGDAGLLRVTGIVDERFSGFGAIDPTIQTLVIDVSELTSMTSSGVLRWREAIAGLPTSLADVYLLGCPTFFVDQLNIIPAFCGGARVVTISAPYTCPACGVESFETVDVLAERATLVEGGRPAKHCSRCGGTLEFDEWPDDYFAFVIECGARNVPPAAALLVASVPARPPRVMLPC